MENNNLAPINAEPQKYEEKKNRKKYKKPNLKHYGSISELVLNNAAVGPDGGGIPTLTFSM